MIRKRLHSLASQRLVLMTRAQHERARLSAAFEPADALAGLAARVGRILEWAARRPFLSGGVLALLVWKKPRLALSWLGRVLTVLKLYGEVRRRFAAPPGTVPGHR